MMKKTKIICSIGPSTQSWENFKGLVEAGMNVARINFSHATLEERKLDENIPHWKDKQFRYDKDKNIEALIKFYKQNDRLPKRDEILETDQYNFNTFYFFVRLQKRSK